MVRACKESREVMTKRFPIRLLSSDPDQEVRVGPADVLSIVDFEFIHDFDRAWEHNLEIPFALQQIKHIGFYDLFSESGDNFSYVNNILEHGCGNLLGGFHNLDSVILYCSKIRPDNHGFRQLHNFTANFDPGLLNEEQLLIFREASKLKDTLGQCIEEWKQSTRDVRYNESNGPEIKIMANGWPTEL